MRAIRKVARHVLGSGVVVGLALGLTAPVAAELFRCRDADGKTIFTDQKSLCPSAEPFEPSGVVHPVDPTPEPPAASAPSLAAPSALDPDASHEEAWQQKKRAAEVEIQRIEKQRSWMRSYVGHCNRGGYVTTRDEAGIQQVVNCSVLRRDFAELEKEEAKVRQYLETGLREECRRSGCLPGWIR